ncbi:MAG: sugar ABC transporter permease [Aquiluna sp.]|uniref:Xylose transport system permease protein XylH n=1 Tax=uncultured Micrococcales bacterium TaxID=1920814 RepID=A0A871YEE5_9MICO|nr:Xylose transport system permease protein XylH [uncultured Micrococcales bacterium]
MTNSNFENGLNLAPTQISSGHEGNLREQFSGYLARLKNGEMGALPAVAALLVLTALFSTLSPFFLTKLNFANLFLQAAQLTTLAVALVFVILLAEIDLSAGVAAGVAMDIFYLATFAGVNWIPALGMSLVFGATVGLVLGLFVAKVGVPSFVITLAFYLALQGVALILLGDGGLFRVDVPEVKSIMNENLPILGGWLLLLVVLGVMLGMGLYDRARRTRKGLVNKPLSLLLIKVGFMAVIGAGVVYVLNLDRSASVKPIYGVPIVIPIVLAIIFIGTFVLDRTTFGRHLYAVGGNPEAARRAGIKVSRIRISAFVITSVLAVIAGLFHVSRIGVVEAAAGRTIVLSGVAAAVVGGVSLFGGRGRLAHAALGAMVIAIIDNGLGLLGLSAGISFLVTGSVLALAATIDAVSRKRGGNLRV